jgi:hypothetical protein
MTMNRFHSPLNLPHLLMLVVLSLILTLAIQPAAAQFGSDGTTLNDFVLDNDGHAWFKARPFGTSSLKPSPQLKFIGDPGNVRGGNALHPDSHGVIEDAIKDVIKIAGSSATWSIEWVTAPGLAGGYQLRVKSERGAIDVSCVQIALERMKLGRQAAVSRLLNTLITIL